MVLDLLLAITDAPFIVFLWNVGPQAVPRSLSIGWCSRAIKHLFLVLLLMAGLPFEGPLVVCGDVPVDLAQDLMHVDRDGSSILVHVAPFGSCALSSASTCMTPS